MRRLIPLALLCALATACGGSKQPRFTGIAYTKYVGSSYEVWLAAADGTAKRRLASGRSPLLSPDGRWVAFHGSCEQDSECRDLFVVATSGGKPRLRARRTFATEWTADSTQLLVYRADSTLLLLGRERGDGVAIARGNVQSWSLSPSDDEVAYALEDRGTDIYVARVDGTHRRQITHDGHSAEPVWGDDGIAFTRRVRGGKLPRHGWGADEIWRVDPDGASRQPLSGPPPRRLLGSGITGLVPIAWRSGVLLAGLANEFGAPPYAVDPKRHRVREIGKYGYHAWPDGLSHDGRSVLVEDGNVEVDRFQRIEVIPFRGGRGRVIARYAGEASWNL